MDVDQVGGWRDDTVLVTDCVDRLFCSFVLLWCSK